MKKKDVILYGGIGAFLIFLFGFKRKTIMKYAKSSLLYAKYGGKEGYIEHIYKIWKEKEPLVKKIWTKDKIINQIKISSSKHQVPFGILYATIQAESGLSPVGNTRVGGGDLTSLKRNKYTAYGMGQIIVGTFIDLVQPDADVNYMHEDLWNPEFGIDATARVLKKKYLQSGRDWYKAIRRYRGVDAIKNPEEANKAEQDVIKRLQTASIIDKVNYV